MTRAIATLWLSLAALVSPAEAARPPAFPAGRTAVPTHITAVLDRGDATLLREHHRVVVRPREGHTESNDVELSMSHMVDLHDHGDEAVLLSEWGGLHTSTGGLARDVTLADLERLQLDRPGRLQETLARRVTSLAGLRGEYPLSLERARKRLRDEIEEVEELNKILTKPSRHRDLSALVRVLKERGSPTLTFARKGDTALFLWPAHRFLIHFQRPWKLGSAPHWPANYGDLADGGLVTRADFDAAIRSALDGLMPTSR